MMKDALNRHGLARPCFWAVLLISLALNPMACSLRKMMVTELAGMAQSGLTAYEGESDLLLLAQAFPAHIKLLETALVSEPRNETLLVLLARLYGAYAFAVLETESEARRYRQPSVVGLDVAAPQLEAQLKRCFQTGAGYALQALACRYGEVPPRLRTADSAAAFFATLGREDVPALFWYGFNLGAYVSHSYDSVQAMASAHLVEKAMQRVLGLEPSYFHSGAHLVLLVYYASRAPMLGGNPSLARQHYEAHVRSGAQAGRLRELYWARYALVQQQRRDAFVEKLNAVAVDPQPGEAFGLLERVAAERAKIYLQAADTFFD